MKEFARRLSALNQKHPVTKSSLINQTNHINEKFNKEDWSSAYCNVEEELTDVTLKIKFGTIPNELNGVFYRNGPGRLERGGQWVHHPFDGDGMIAAIKFKGGKVTFSNRFIKTKEWEEEEKAGEFTYRGVFGTPKPGGVFKNAFDLRLKNIANTNVIKLGDQLLALWEAAGPHALNPDTLITHGLTTLNGALKQGEAFSAHPRFDPGHHGTKNMVTFGVKTGPTSTIRLMEFSTEGNNSGELISDRKDNFPGFAFLHDFAITPNWAIFLQNALSFNPIPFVLGKKGAAQCLSSNKKEKSKIILIPRDCGKHAGESPRTINGPDGFVFHHLNAYEKDNKIYLDSIYYKDFPSIGPDEDFRDIDFNSLPEGKLKRCAINLTNSTIKENLFSPQCCEFAMVNPTKQGYEAQFSWMAVTNSSEGNGPLQGIKKLDLTNNNKLIWSAAPRGFVSEPLYIPHINCEHEDSGWIICLTWNAAEKTTELVILDSQDLTLRCKLEIPFPIPHGLHGSWVNN